MQSGLGRSNSLVPYGRHGGKRAKLPPAVMVMVLRRLELHSNLLRDTKSSRYDVTRSPVGLRQVVSSLYVFYRVLYERMSVGRIIVCHIKLGG